MQHQLPRVPLSHLPIPTRFQASALYQDSPDQRHRPRAPLYWFQSLSVQSRKITQNFFKALLSVHVFSTYSEMISAGMPPVRTSRSTQTTLRFSSQAEKRVPPAPIDDMKASLSRLTGTSGQTISKQAKQNLSCPLQSLCKINVTHSHS